MRSVFVVGLDGATWKVLKPLIKRKKLPFIENLMDSSSFGLLESTIPPLSAPAWVTFQTGVNPGKHAIFEFLNYRTKDGSPVLNTANNIKSKRIWEILAEYDLKSLVINMPLSYPVKKMKGIIISSFLTPIGATFAYPKSVEKVLKNIDYEIDLLVDNTYGLMPDKKLSAKDRGYYLQRLLEISKKRVIAYKLLNRTDKFSFQFILFKECDVAQHLFWGLPELSKFYISLDLLLGHLYEEYQKQEGDKNFIIISDHGFHKAAVRQFSPYVFLGSFPSEKNAVIPKNIWKLARLVNAKLNEYDISHASCSFIRKISNFLLDYGRRDLTKSNRITPTLFGIYFNKMNSGEKEILMIKMLYKLKSLNKKHKIFDVVFTPGEFYRGGYLKDLPDIIWKVNEGYTIDTSPYAENLISSRESRLRGDHEADRNGIFIANGKFLKKGSFGNEKIENIPLLTLKLLGLSVPWYFDGKFPKFYMDEINYDYQKKVKDIIDSEMGAVSK